MAEPAKTSEAIELNTSWAMPHNLGRQYAALSGDYNPVHLWPWSAKLFGFKKPIANGMYSIAKVQASIEDRMDKKFPSSQRISINLLCYPFS
jgi:acyl dehydratase